MSTYEELVEDGRREKAEAEYEAMRPDDCKQCGSSDWRLLGTDSAYGADADGRRGAMLREWECRGCGNVVEVVYQ
jgi:hypothetical protein